MNNLKWNPKDPDGLIGVPGKGYIKASDFSQEDLNNLINRAKNRKIDVASFLLGAGLVPAKPQLDLVIEEVDEDEEEPKKRVRRTKAEIEAAK
jgi:hypothetical protein